MTIENMSNEEIMHLIFLGVILVFFLFSLLSNPGKNINKALKTSLIWVALFFLLISLYAFRFEINNFKNRFLAVLIPSYSWSGEEGSLNISRHQDGHFYLYAHSENNESVKFLVDTGATGIALTMKDAIKLGVNIKILRYTQKYNTANGVNYGAPTRILQIKIGEKIFYNVRAHVMQKGLDVSLLGMSLIDHFKDFQISRDLLILRY